MTKQIPILCVVHLTGESYQNECQEGSPANIGMDIIKNCSGGVKLS